MSSALTGLALIALLVPVALIDVRRRIIPNRLTAAGSVVALALAAASADPGVVTERLLAGAGAGGFLLAAALVRPGGMGMGDVKLAAVLGLFLGPAVAIALLTALVAGALAGAWALARQGAAAARAATIPFGPFLALGAAVAWLVGVDTLAWYGRLGA